MALSMDEQRMLAEIERRLAAEDPGFATRLSSFRRPRPAAGLRSTRGKLIGSLCTLVFLAIIAVTVYAATAVRGHTLKTSRTSQSAASQSAGARTSTSTNPAPAKATRIAGVNNVASHNG